MPVSAEVASQAPEFVDETNHSAKTSWPDYSLLIKLGAPLLLALFAIVYVRECFNSSCAVGGKQTFLLWDDAMICMRFAYNLAHGAGLVWNPGELVEGYTNLGWVLVMAAVHLLPIPLTHTSLAIQLINLGIYLALLAYVGRWLAPKTGPALTLLGLTLIAFNAPMLYWSIAGFEVPLQSLLLTMALLPLIPQEDGSFADKSKWPLIPVLLGVAYFVRPDSIVLLATTTLFFVAYRLLRPTDLTINNAAKILLGTAIGFAVVLGVHGFQLLYYGEWFPNTYYLKVTDGAREFERGCRYLLTYVFYYNQAPTVFCTILFCWWGVVLNVLPWLGFTACVASWFAYTIWVGGDAFTLSRFYTPMTPLLAVSTVLLVHRFFQKVGLDSIHSVIERLGLPSSTQRQRDIACASVLLCSAAVLGLIICKCQTDLVPEIGNLSITCENTVFNVEDLRRINIQPDEVVAVFFGGGPPYLMPEQKFHDPFGKCDRRLAHMQAKWGPPGHNKWDFDYLVNDVKPAAIITNQTLSQYRDTTMQKMLRERTDFSNVCELWYHPGFIKKYKNNKLISGFDSNREIYLSPEAAEGREIFLEKALDHRSLQTRVSETE